MGDEGLHKIAAVFLNLRCDLNIQLVSLRVSTTVQLQSESVGGA